MNKALEGATLSVWKVGVATTYYPKQGIAKTTQPRPPTLLARRHPIRDTRAKRRSCSLSIQLSRVLYKTFLKCLDGVLSLRMIEQIRVSEKNQLLQLYHKRFVESSNKERILPRLYSLYLYILRGVLNSQPLYGTNKYTLI